MTEQHTSAPTENTSPAASIKVLYWFGEGDLAGIEEFRHELASSYESAEVTGRQAGLGGGLYTLFVEIASTVTLSHVVQLLLDGVAFDLIKLGADRLILRPFLAAQARLRSKSSRDEAGDIAQLKIVFRDAVLLVDGDSRVWQNVADALTEVFDLLAQNYDRLILDSGQRPSQVYIPVVEDAADDPISRFRAVLEVDEHLRINERVLLEYWGVTYADGHQRVFDVERRLLIDQPFVLREEYWQVMESRWRARRQI